MKQLLMKEIKLVITPATYLFPLLCALLLIPSYPYMVGVSYFFFSIQIGFQTARGNKDAEFTALLPLSRDKVVLSKFINVLYTEFIQLLFAVPFALITSLVVNKGGNLAGMDANIAFFGEALIAYGIFNLIFLPGYFKTGYKVGMPLLFALLGYLVTVVAIEVIVQLVPVLRANLDSLAPSTFGYQAIMLVLGILVFAVCTVCALKVSKKHYNNVNL